MGVSVSHTLGFTSGRSSAGGRGEGELAMRGKRKVSVCGKVMVACNFTRISHPRRGTGQEGMTRKEWVKMEGPNRQVKGGVW